MKEFTLTCMHATTAEHVICDFIEELLLDYGPDLILGIAAYAEDAKKKLLPHNCLYNAKVVMQVKEWGMVYLERIK